MTRTSIGLTATSLIAAGRSRSPNRCYFAALLLLPAASPAQAQLILGGEARVEAATNPLLLAGGNNDAIMGEISVKPEYKTVSATGDSFDLAGVLTERRYSRRYSNYVLGSVRATGALRENEHFSAKVSAGYLRDVSGDTLTTDVDGLVSPQSIRNSWQGEMSAIWRPNARTAILPEISAERTTFDRTALLQSTSSASAAIGFRRLLTETTAIGIRPVANLSRTRLQPNLHRLAVFGTVNKSFSSILSLAFEAGVEHVAGADATGLFPARKGATAFSGAFSLCRTAEYASGCLTASIGSDVSALYGFQRRKAIGARFSKRLDERRTLMAEADYQRISAPPQSLQLRDLDGISGRIALDWRLSQSATISGELRYARRTIDTGGRPQSGYAGLRFRWQPRLR